MAKDTLRYVPLTQVVPNTVALRKVNTESEKYHELVQSIREKGILNPIVVREVKDDETNALNYTVVDGLHRYTAAKDAGLDTIPVHIISVNQAEMLEAQIVANIQRVETRAAEYSEQLQRLLVFHPTMTASELALKLGQSPSWISERLGLLRLTDSIKELVNDGKINTTNACALAKLPADEQPNFVQQAITMSPVQFKALVNQRVQQVRSAKKSGKPVTPVDEYVPVPHVQKMVDLRNEMTNPQVGPSLIQDQGVSDPVQAWKLALSWVLHLDPRSIESARASEADRRRKLEEEKATRAKEREDKKNREAAVAAASVA